MSLDSLEKLFIEELKDMYNAEKQQLRSLARMAKAADSPELKQGFTKHQKETEGQIQRLERVFREVGQPVRGRTCKGMQGLVEESREMLEKDAEPAVLDAALIAAAQRAEHYEIAVYGCLRSYAELIGMEQAVKLLQQNLEEEEATDEILTQLGQGGINEAALAVGSLEEEQ
jgi:ferritin-like metal-binding protein YciE